MFEQKCPHPAIKSAHTLHFLPSLISGNPMNSRVWLAPRDGFEPPTERLTVVCFFNKINYLMVPTPMSKRGVLGPFLDKVPTPFWGANGWRMPMI